MARGRGRGRGDWSVGAPGGVQEITYTVPADKCGLVIGKGEGPLLGFRGPPHRSCPTTDRAPAVPPGRDVRSVGCADYRCPVCDVSRLL